MTTVRYGDFAVGAKEQFVVEASEKMPFVNLEDLNLEKINIPNYGNPCELYSVTLDGKTTPFPSELKEETLGYWSEQVSSLDGSFENPVQLIFSAEENFSSSQISLTFDIDNGIYATHLRIDWYRGSELISSKDFYPSSAFYLCKNSVEFYNKIVITFYSINMPYTRLRLRALEYGRNVVFEGEDIKSVTITQSIDPLSAELEINTAELTIDARGEVDYSWQVRQPLSIEYDGMLKSTTFVTSAKKRSSTVWDIRSEDYIGLMDTIPFNGGMYSNESGLSLIDSIFKTAKVPYSIEGDFEDDVLSGFIPISSCREALKQVLFVLGAVADTANSDVVKVSQLSSIVSQSIPSKRIMQGISFDEASRVTAVEVSAHRYKAIEDEYIAYEGAESGGGENVFVRFNEPLHSLSITGGAILSSGANFAVINATESTVLMGKKYEHVVVSKSQTNPLVLATDTENVLKVREATLVSPKNLDKVLEKCYNELVKVNTINLDIVDGKHVSGGGTLKYGQAKYGMVKYRQKMPKITTYDPVTNVGDIIEIEAKYAPTKGGRVLKQSYNLNGGIIVKKTVLR